MTRLPQTLLLALALVASFALGAGDKAPNARLLVSFGSICCGPDAMAVEALARVISGYEKRIGHPIEATTVHWGKEGDFSRCFSLREMNASTRRRFVDDVRAALAKGRAEVSENTPCPEGRTMQKWH